LRHGGQAHRSSCSERGTAKGIRCRRRPLLLLSIQTPGLIRLSIRTRRSVHMRSCGRSPGEPRLSMLTVSWLRSIAIGLARGPCTLAGQRCLGDSTRTSSGVETTVGLVARAGGSWLRMLRDQSSRRIACRGEQWIAWSELMVRCFSVDAGWKACDGSPHVRER